MWTEWSKWQSQCSYAWFQWETQKKTYCDWSELILDAQSFTTSTLSWMWWSSFNQHGTPLTTAIRLSSWICLKRLDARYTPPNNCWLKRSVAWLKAILLLMFCLHALPAHLICIHFPGASQWWCWIQYVLSITNKLARCSSAVKRRIKKCQPTLHAAGQINRARCELSTVMRIYAELWDLTGQ